MSEVFILRCDRIDAKVWQDLADLYPTKEAWHQSSEDKIKTLLGRENQDLAGVVLTRIQEGIAGVQQ
jgi:hypothetical protein